MERVKKSATNFYKSLYYLFASIFGYVIIRDLDCLPPMMGGNGVLVKMFDDYPTFEKHPFFDFYYVFITGYHLESLYTHLFGSKNTDYTEMIFHHVLTLNLIFISYLSCFTKGGILVLWLHLWADIFTAFTRAVSNIKDIYALISYLFLLTTWFYSRLYSFGFIIYEIFVTDVHIHGIDQNLRNNF